ncbi:mitochondrial mRNA pseudouridine synthase RPUSD3-like [Athalia rosae]|uniref:mitochondrial mRNA pseudouridine synthase RPUSD3-like n=1 Tax=Athalia rosae TaxID=37344 RepID=UPI0020336EB2|nr:mitochondrial mRNA pseudouridine synthase RPUSD3-like [Athalia rosae]
MKKTLHGIYECALVQNFGVFSANRLSLRRNYNTEPKITENDKQIKHPYQNLHPWKSINEFSKHLLDNVLYNDGGVVVLNKPYGISNKLPKDATPDSSWNLDVGIPNAVDYTLAQVLPNISKELGYPSLSIVKSPEKHTSGVAILADTEATTNAVLKSLARAQCAKIFSNTYWIVTTKLPRSNCGQLNLAITKKESPCRSYKQPIILTEWAKNDVKRGVVKTFDVSYRKISNSLDNLSSLMEIKCFTVKWHAIRVFASTVLLSPVLGDNIHGSRVKKILGKYLQISPFVDAAKELPILEPALLKKLNLSSEQRIIIPPHIHLREVILPSFPTRGKEVKFVAPLPTGFEWTCQQLQFRIPTESEETPPEQYLVASQ